MLINNYMQSYTHQNDAKNPTNNYDGYYFKEFHLLRAT